MRSYSGLLGGIDSHKKSKWTPNPTVGLGSTSLSWDQEKPFGKGASALSPVPAPRLGISSGDRTWTSEKGIHSAKGGQGKESHEGVTDVEPEEHLLVTVLADAQLALLEAAHSTLALLWRFVPPPSSHVNLARGSLTVGSTVQFLSKVTESLEAGTISRCFENEEESSTHRVHEDKPLPTFIGWRAGLKPSKSLRSAGYEIRLSDGTHVPYLPANDVCCLEPPLVPFGRLESLGNGVHTIRDLHVAAKVCSTAHVVRILRFCVTVDVRLVYWGVHSNVATEHEPLHLPSGALLSAARWCTLLFAHSAIHASTYVTETERFHLQEQVELTIDLLTKRRERSLSDESHIGFSFVESSEWISFVEDIVSILSVPEYRLRLTRSQAEEEGRRASATKR